ncbi:site-specific DNA-methyltransferase [Nocardioides dubius]|uniref:DNA methylase N-4/N-6 domain-containing protein n=1 Tax=Nocardioides dubius TaxID=317019 RepID=A0ABP4EKX9_9ACTN
MGATNTLIVGDNLDVLPTLARESVDVVYIDPPYNTGNGFAYHDRHGTGAERHRMWVEMMRPRLVAAREVMAAHAALFVSIDDNEVAHLRLLLDEVFGERNFVAQVVVNLNPKGRQLGPFFATSHEYLLIYARDAARCTLDPTSAHTVKPSDFPLEFADGRRYRHLPLRNTNKKFNPLTAPTLHYPLWGEVATGRVSTEPFDGAQEIRPVFGDGAPAVWRWSAPLVQARPDDVVCRTVRGKLGERIDVYQRDWLHEGRRKKLPTIWLAEEVGSTDTAVAELKQILGPVFASPKPTGLIRRVLDCFGPDAVVLDFFAGSGTTGHATVLANAADGGNRRAILVNSPEPTQPGSSAALAGYATVSDVTEARLRAVDALLGGGFQVQQHPDGAELSNVD